MKKIILTLTAIITPTLVMAGGGGGVTVDPEYLEAVKFMQGGNVVEQWFLEFSNKIIDFGEEYFNKYIVFAQLIGAIMGLLYFGNKAWGFLSGDKKWEILPLLRPLAFAMVIANWTPLVQSINSIFSSMENVAREEVGDAQEELLGIRVLRFEVQNQMIDQVIEKRTEAKMAMQNQENENSAWGLVPFSGIGDAIDEMAVWISTMYMKLQFNLQLVISNLLETICLTIMRLVIYGILYIQKIFILFLIILGPISFGFSILPKFENAWVGWLMKFLGVQFWGIIAYTILQMGIMIQKFAMQAELDRYHQIIDQDSGEIISMELLTAFGQSGGMSFNMVIVAYLLTAIGLLMTPTLSSFVLGSASNASAATSKGQRVATKAVSKGLL